MNDISMQPVTDASAWRGSEMETDRSWEYFLEDGHIRELESALGAVKKSGRQLAEISAADFPLLKLSKMLAAIAADVQSGPGFALLRGFPVAAHDNAELELMYYGLCRHIGMAMTQNSDAGLIHYVTAGALKPNQGSRAVGFPKFVRLHVDLMDIVTLLCVRQADDAPQSHLASSTTIYNEILKRRPDLMPRLRAGFEWDRMGEHAAGETPTSGYRVPLFSQVNGVVSCRYNRSWMASANARKKQSMPEGDEAILDLIDEIAAETRLAFPFQNGDIQFCNNYTTLHGRDAHAVERQEDRMRVLMRIWLNVPGFRQFSDEAVVRYGIGCHGNLGWSAADLAAQRNKSPRARRGDGAVLMDG
ncbi:MAG: TauD/TfdA family dioxygenase [Alphaproteobacteria bacterium]|nr:TauD/TfdA family dioxygenase [Alphaproteobacteria bacterium]